LTPIDVKRYGRLLAQFAPKVIESEAENDAALAMSTPPRLPFGNSI
jgi:hypothetical protein